MKRFISYLTRELNLDTSQSEVIEYGLSSLLFTSLSLIMAIILSVLLGLLYETMSVLSVMMLYRKVSGGAHVSSPHGCLFLGTVIILLLAYLTTLFAPLYAGNALTIFVPPCLAMIIAYLRVPADVPQKPITSVRQIKTLRLLSFSMITLWGLLGVYVFITKGKWSIHYFAGNLGLLWQSFLLTPLGYQVIAIFDPLFLRNGMNDK
ncbi:MAG: accessory gene regulator B family protein [Firmicutes bacterium]|nr:accessory gene regulator B family protein [Bacillota bacterium]